MTYQTTLFSSLQAATITRWLVYLAYNLVKAETRPWHERKPLT